MSKTNSITRAAQRKNKIQNLAATYMDSSPKTITTSNVVAFFENKGEAISIRLAREVCKESLVLIDQNFQRAISMIIENIPTRISKAIVAKELRKYVNVMPSTRQLAEFTSIIKKARTEKFGNVLGNATTSIRSSDMNILDKFTKMTGLSRSRSIHLLQKCLLLAIARNSVNLIELIESAKLMTQKDEILYSSILDKYNMKD